MAIVGITPRMDAINMLEKRLWSRFSHRRVLVSRPDFVTLCKVSDACVALFQRRLLRCHVGTFSSLQVLENALCLPLEAVEQGLFTEEEVQQHNSAVTAAIAASEVQSRVSTSTVLGKALFDMERAIASCVGHGGEPDQ